MLIRPGKGAGKTGEGGLTARRDPLLLASIVAGATYLPAYWLLPHGPWLVAWKGAGVGLLALWARRSVPTREGVWIAAILLMGAIGDVLIDTVGLVSGAVAFLDGHVLATIFYLRHRRKEPLTRWAPIASARLTVIPVLAFSFPDDRTAAPGIALYALSLGAMAASAWMSRFPRNRVSLGALLFAVSDLLIFAKMGLLRDSIVASLLNWPLYFAGQALIAMGVVFTLKAELGNADPAPGKSVVRTPTPRTRR
jgi:uncharacterized membrane protein YhhN